MKNRHDHNYSLLRQQLLALATEYQQAVAALLGHDMLVRGTLNCDVRAARRYPGITRVVHNRKIGRRVRLEHVAWLTPLLARHKAYRQTEAQLRRLHQRILALAEDLRAARLYDHEPQASADNYLVKVTPEDAHGA